MWENIESRGERKENDRIKCARIVTVVGSIGKSYKYKEHS